MGKTRMKVRKHIRALVGAVSFVGVLVTILGFAVPTARDWMLRNAGLGWLLVGILLTTTLVLAVLLDGSNQRVTTEAQAHEAELEKAHGATKQVEAERNTARQDLADERLGAQRIADGELLTERLGPWRQGCSIMVWLKYSMDGDKIPVPFDEQINRRRRLWDNDTRTLACTPVETAFD